MVGIIFNIASPTLSASSGRKLWRRSYCSAPGQTGRVQHTHASCTLVIYRSAVPSTVKPAAQWMLTPRGECVISALPAVGVLNIKPCATPA